MRKFLWVVAAGTLVLALAAPAGALDFKYGGEFRVRFYTGAGVGFTSTTGSDQRGAQLRVRPLFTVSDDNNNIQAVLRLEIGDIEFGNGGGASSVQNGVNNNGGNFNAFTLAPSNNRTGNGSGGSIGSDGVNVETKWAYIDAAFPFGVPLRVRAGLQPWFLPKGLIVDDDVIGVRAYGNVKPVSYELAWYRQSGGTNNNTGVCPSSAVNTGVQCNPAPANTADNNIDFLQAKIDVAIDPAFNPGIYYLYGRNAATFASAITGNTNGDPQTSNYIGFTAAGKVGTVSYDLDFVWGQAWDSPTGNVCQTLTGAAVVCGAPNALGRNVSGYAVDAGVHAPIGPVTLNLVGSIASGDKRDGGNSEAFPSISPSWNGPGGLFHVIGSGGIHDPLEFSQDAPTNLWTVGLTADYRPVKQLLITAGAAFAGFMQAQGNCAYINPGVNQACFGPGYTRLSNDRNGNGVPDAPSTLGGLNKASPYLGTETFLWSSWDVWTGFKVQGLVGFLLPTTGTTAQKYILQLLYSF